MQLVTYLNFRGNCREAFKFYAEVFGGKLDMFTYGDSPMCDQTPPELRNNIMHASLQVEGAMLFGGDPPPEMHQTPQGFGIAIAIEDIERAERIFNALAQGGQIRMPLQETFWAKRFGDLVDRFGTPWMVSAGEKPLPNSK